MLLKTDYKDSLITLINLALLLFILLVLPSGCSEDRAAVNADLSESGQSDARSDLSLEDEIPVLNVAIGAMISPEVTREYYHDLLHLIAEQMGARLSISQRRTYAEVNGLVENREVDFAFVCSGAYVKGHEDFGMELLVVPVTNGESVYYSYVIVNKESVYNSLLDLRGSTFVFTDPDSNTGCLVPRYMLVELNETPESFFSSYYYTYSHDNSIHAVADGLADGAAVDSLIWEYLNSEGFEYVKATRIIQKSDPFGIPPVVVNPELDSETKQRLKEIFLNIHKDERVVPILSGIKIERFIEGEDSNYNSIREMLEWTAGTAGECNDD